MIRVVSALSLALILTALAPFAFTIAAESTKATPSVHFSAAMKKGDTVKGSAIAQAVCASCHAADGNGVGNLNPKLAGQHPEYIVKQLQDFKVKAGAKAPARSNGIMSPIAMAMTEEDMIDVAAFYASQALKPSSARNKDTVSLGQKIYRGGIAEKNIPACAACHAPNGAGIPVQYPRLSGQWAEYHEAQLQAFRSGARGNNPVMNGIAARMSDLEIKAVSDYMAGLR